MNKVDVLLKKKQSLMIKGIISLPGISQIANQNMVISIMGTNYKKNCHKTKQHQINY